MGVTGSFVRGGSQNTVAAVRFDLDEATMAKMNKRMRDGIWAMAYGVRERAMFRAPVVTGTLYNTIRVEDWTDDGIEIAAGGKFGTGMDGKTRYVGYAYKREKGPNRHKETEHYMEYGLADIMESDWQNTYFKGVAL